MLYRNSIGAAVLAAVFVAAIADVRAQDETKYPDWSGQWLRTGGIQWDPTKPHWSRTAGSPDAGISGDLRSKPRGPNGGRSRQ